MRKLNLILYCFFILFSLGFNADKKEFRIIKENGIPVAINPDHPVPTKNSPKDIVFKEELILGSTGGDPKTTFGEFISYTVDDQENVYILDWRAKTVRKFGPRGDYLLSFGKAGQGPGEFSYPEEIRFLPAGHLIIFEGESQKFSVFNLNGDFVKSGRFFNLMYPTYFGLSNGNFIATQVKYDKQKTGITTGLFNGKSELLAVLHQKENKLPQPWPRNDPDARARRLAESMSRTAFKRTAVVALDAKEAIYFAFSDKYEIKVYSSEAKLKRIIRSALPLRPVTKRDQEDFLNIWVPRDISTWSTMNEKMKNKIKNLIQFPATKPAFLEIIPMNNGSIMVLRDGNFGHNALINIFDSQGRFIIEKDLPFPIRNGLSKGNKLYTIFEDKDGYKFVKRYRLQFLKDIQ
jgi:hypothetical protein